MKSDDKKRSYEGTQYDKSSLSKDYFDLLQSILNQLTAETLNGVPLPPNTAAKDVAWDGRYFWNFVSNLQKDDKEEFEKLLSENRASFGTLNRMPYQGATVDNAEIAICTSAQILEIPLNEYIESYVVRCKKRKYNIKGFKRHDETIKSILKKYALDNSKENSAEIEKEEDFDDITGKKDSQGLEFTIEDLKKFIAESKNKAFFENNLTAGDNEKKTEAITNPSSNIEPVIGETKWLDPYNFSEIPLAGREKEFDLLNKFIEGKGQSEAENQFKIWAISGPSGSGKTRLAIEWAFKSPILADWNRYVLHKEDRTEPEKWAKWSSERPTLIIIDYMYGFDEVILQLMHHRSEPKAAKIRLLLIDHVFSENLASDKRWGLSGHGSNRNQNEKYFFDLKPLDLRQAENQEEIIENIIAHRAGLDRKRSQILKAREYLRNTQGAYHPLFAALVGDAIRLGKDVTELNRRELIDYYLSGDDRLPWKHESETGILASYFIAGATARRGMNYDDLFKGVEDYDLSAKDSVQVQEICQRVIATDNDVTLAPFEPDILGESFFLKFLQYFRYASKQKKAFHRVFMAGSEETQTEDAIEFIAFIQRLTRNLLNDDQNHKETRALWNALFSFMTPSNFEDAKPIKWAVTAGLIDIADAIKDKFSEDELITLLNKVDPGVLHRDTNENSLWDSVVHSMRYLELKHRNAEILPVLTNGILDLFDRFTENSSDGETPLMYASYYSFNNVIKALISCKVNLEATLSGGQNTLMTASFMGNTEAVEWLLNANADIHATDNGGHTPLIWASDNDHWETVVLLLDRGAKIDAADNAGRTALITASAKGHMQIVWLLLDEGADIDVTDNNGSTALMRASGNDHRVTVALLFDRGAKIDAVDNAGRTALITASANGHIELVELLVDRGANIDATDNAGRTALIASSAEGQIQMVELLLDRGANIDATDNNGSTALIRASANSHIETIQLLLDRGAKIDAADNNGSTALIWASVNICIENIQLLLDRGANIDATENDGRTALFGASAEGHVETIKLLLNKGAKIDIGDKDGLTALYYASGYGHVETVGLLIDNGANINNKAYDNRTILIYASSKGDVKMVRLLLDRGANIHDLDNDGRTALIRACTNGHLEMVRLLLDKGAKIDIADENGRGALWWASIRNHLKPVELLLDRGADIHGTDNAGRTALIAASAASNNQIITLLLNKGAKINTADNNGATALICSSRNGYIQTVGLLLDRGAKIEIADKDGHEALWWASVENHWETVELLIDNGADIHTADNIGLTALVWASGYGHMETVNLLLDRGAKINAFDNRGHTALIWASGSGHRVTVELLLDKGAEINVADKNNRSALFWACLNNHVGVVELLLNRNARVDVVDNKGQTALSIAKAKGHEEIAQLLVNHGAEN